MVRKTAPVVLPPSPKGRHRFRGIVVTLGAMLLSALALHASEFVTFPKERLLGGVAASKVESRCPEDMAFVSSSGGGYCIDRYEASPGVSCPHQRVTNQFDTDANTANPLCTPISAPGTLPWVNVSLTRAMELCARAGKHLATNAEWYRAALGTPDDVCVLGRVGLSVAELTGSRDSCFSSSGAYDMIGNVWEWVDATAIDGVYDGRTLPGEGYVAETDTNGLPTRTATATLSSFGGDHFYIDPVGVKGMFRGGFWNMTEKAGVYATNVANPTSFVGNAVGFRCAK